MNALQAAPGGDAVAEAAGLEALLRDSGTPERAVKEKAYLKSDLDFAGVPVPALRTMVSAWCAARPDLTREELTGVVRALWLSSLYECRQAAVLLLERRGGLLSAADAGLIEELLRTSGTWALVDGLAATVMGGLAERHAELAGTLDRWATDDDFWIRRSALLALLGPLHRGGGDFARFSRYADTMLADREFFVRKAIGWVLRETAKRRPELVASWLGPRVHRASGVTVREAVKYLPARLRTELMVGYQEGHPVHVDP